MTGKQILIRTARLASLFILFPVFFISGTLALSGQLPDIPSEPGLLSNNTGLLTIALANTLLIVALIRFSRWQGWRLALTISMAYYGAVTFMTQIETWYFLSAITIDEKILLRLFIMGLPVAFIYIPLAVWIMGQGRSNATQPANTAIVMSFKQWIGKLGTIALCYLLLYWCAGYFIAWQNPALRAFYGSPGAIVPFWEHTRNTLLTNPDLFSFQILRALLWILCTLPIIRGSKLSIGRTTILLGLFLTVPQCLGLLLENPLMPIASVRLSHLMEGLTSNFLFAVIIVWLLHREHTSFPDLFGIKPKAIHPNSSPNKVFVIHS